MYISRSLNPKLTELLKYFPAVAIVGARQVGKSTWLKNTLESEFNSVVFDPLIDVGNARQDPELFLRSRRTHKPSKASSKPLILDEIQYVPQLVPVLKRLIDEDRTPGQYILTGSQQWEVMKSLSESLAGRVAFIDLEGFNLSEISHQSEHSSWLEKWIEDPVHFVSHRHERLELNRSIHEVIWRGSFPEVTFLPLGMSPTYFASYMRTYVERDVR